MVSRAGSGAGRARPRRPARTSAARFRPVRATGRRPSSVAHEPRLASPACGSVARLSRRPRAFTSALRLRASLVLASPHGSECGRVRVHVRPASASSDPYRHPRPYPCPRARVSTAPEAGSRKRGAGSRERGAGCREAGKRGAGRRKPEAGSGEREAGSGEPGAGRRGSGVPEGGSRKRGAGSGKPGAEGRKGGGAGRRNPGSGAFGPPVCTLSGIDSILCTLAESAKPNQP